MDASHLVARSRHPTTTGSEALSHQTGFLIKAISSNCQIAQAHTAHSARDDRLQLIRPARACFLATFGSWAPCWPLRHRLTGLAPAPSRDRVVQIYLLIG